MITVFYDGKCGLCSREIGYYRKIAPAGVFDWQDITKCTDGLKKAGIPVSEAFKLLHVQDHEGGLHIGVNAFIMIWKQLKYWRILAVLINLPGIHLLAKIGYKIFAIWRFRKVQNYQSED